MKLRVQILAVVLALGTILQAVSVYADRANSPKIGKIFKENPGP